MAILDATNTTKERRKLLYERIVEGRNFKLFFVESICNDDKIIESNIKEVKTESPDYSNLAEDKILEDFKKRIGHYQEKYETLDEFSENMYSFMKIFDCGRKVTVHKHEGHIQSRSEPAHFPKHFLYLLLFPFTRIVYYLMNIRVVPRTLYLSRHGQSSFNSLNRLGGDSDLTVAGENYSKRLAAYINGLNIENVFVWTSWLKRTIQTAQYIKGTQERSELLCFC